MDTTKTKELSYYPLIYHVTVSSKKDSITDNDIKPIFSLNSVLPRFNLGYHWYNHATKDKMEITKTLQIKRKFYYIINEFEHRIEGAPEESVSTYTKELFSSELGIV